MGFSVGSPHGCCGLRANSWEALKCVSRCGLKGAERWGPRTRVVCCYVNSRSGHALRDGVRVPGRELHGAVALIRSAGRRGGALRADAAAKGRDGWSQISLDDVCRRLHLCFFEICVQNMGRSAGQAMHEFVCAAVDAFMAGYSFDKLNLQMVHGTGGIEEFKMENAGYRLTASEEYYRTQWLTTIYVTLQMMKLADNEASRSFVTENLQLVQIIHRTLEGQRHGEEQSLVKFDRGLATKGASGGAVSEKLVISPQWVPVTQIVLLTLKVVNENQ